MADCPVGRKCHICSSVGHLARHCPIVYRDKLVMVNVDPKGVTSENVVAQAPVSYADVARGVKPTESVQAPDTVLESQVPSLDPLSDVGREEGTSSLMEECVPETLAAEGEEEVDEEENEEAVENPQGEKEEMDQSVTLKMKISIRLWPNRGVPKPRIVCW